MPYGTSCGLWAAQPARFPAADTNSPGVLAAAALLVSLGWCCRICSGQGAVEGVVRDGQGPVSGAIVRV
ncbi:MAG: hypothetical protein ACYS7Y_25555, partial [Planctomycetota bacterium]